LNQLENFIRVCRRYLVLRSTDYIDIIFGTIFANRLDSDPVWIYIVGPPGSGKSEVLRACNDHPVIHTEGKMTKNRLVSGFIAKDGKDTSLIPQLDGKVMIIEDFTQVLNMRREDIHEILGDLRKAYDGDFSKGLGTQKKAKKFVSKFGLIAGVTNAIDAHRGMLASLGERFLTYRMPEISEYEKQQRSMKASDDSLTSEQRRKLKIAAHLLLDSEPRVPTIKKDLRRKIVQIAQVVAKARTEVIRNYKTREPEIPVPEVATRLSKQLVDLCKGVAMARNKRVVTKSEISLIRQSALHCITLKRYKLFQYLMSHYPDWVGAPDIATSMGFSTLCVEYWLQDLLLLNLIDRKVILVPPNMHEAYLWRLKDGNLLGDVFD